MPFVELTPQHAKQRDGTGVRLSVGGRGLRLSLAGEALRAVVGKATAFPIRIRLLADLDLGVFQIRIQPAKDGPFELRRSALTKRPDLAFVHVGRVPGLVGAGAAELPACDCTWELVDGGAGIDIDLPRALRTAVTHSVSQPRAGAATASTSNPAMSRVSLAGQR